MANQVHLRDFYYNSYSTQQSRHAALTDAVNACGWDAVYDRLSVVTDLNVQNNTESAPNMQSDLEWLKSFKPVKKEVSQVDVRLKDYGYSSMQTENLRHNSLVKAIESVGKDNVVKRLNYVIEVAKEPRRSIYIQDMNWTNAYKVPPPTPVNYESEDEEDEDEYKEDDYDDDGEEHAIIAQENQVQDVEKLVNVEKIKSVLLEMEDCMKTLFIEMENRMKTVFDLL